MIAKQIIKMSAWMMSGLIFCPLVTMAQLYTVEINVDETPFMSDITIECLNDNIRLTVHLENAGLQATYTLSNTTPASINVPQTNTTGIFIIPNFHVLQTAVLETDYGLCSDSKQIFIDCILPVDIVVPVNIIDIYAQLINDNEADVIWKIAKELNVKHYVVEKSANGYTFDQIGIVPVTSELSNFKTYKYNDKPLFAGINYYRVKIEDLDGTIYYTKIVSVNSESGDLIGFRIYPNPTSNNLFVEYNNLKATYLDLSIYNQIGQKVKTFTFADGVFPKIIELSLQELVAGTYIIKATDQQGNETISKFLKML